MNRSYRCPKVLAKPIHEDKSSPRYRVGAGTYSFREMSNEVARFRDTIEYSTNAMFYQKVLKGPSAEGLLLHKGAFYALSPTKIGKNIIG